MAKKELDEQQIVADAQSVDIPDFQGNAEEAVTKYIKKLVKRIQEVLDGLPWYVSMFVGRLVEGLWDAIVEAKRDLHEDENADGGDE